MTGKTIPQKMLELLSDGEPKSREELHKLCGPSRVSIVRWHLFKARSLLPENEMIICTIQNRQIRYIRVRKLVTNG